MDDFSPGDDSTTSQSSWSETYPPKLTSQVVADLKQKFKRNYPAEVLLPETTPSLRLLSLIHHQKTKGEYKWVPWKFRLSQSKAHFKIDTTGRSSSRCSRSGDA
jgi:hypothetical protein